jgi:hypothetical protein
MGKNPLDVDSEDTLLALGLGHRSVALRFGFIRRRRLANGP